MYPSTDSELSRKVDVCLHQGIKRLEALENHNSIAGSSLKLLRHCYRLLQEASSSRVDIRTAVEPRVEVSEPDPFEQPQETCQGATGFEMSNNFENLIPLGVQAPEVFEQMHFPSTLDITRFSNINEFDSSYWIEQMNQIPFVAMDDANADSSWEFTFSG